MQNKVKRIKKLFKEYNKNKEKIKKYNNILVKENKEIYLVDMYKIVEIESCKNDLILAELLYIQLDEKEKEIIDMRYKEKLSIIEVSEKIYVSDSTLYRMIRRIFSKLEKYYNKFEELFKNK